MKYAFVRVGATNRDKRGSFCPDWCYYPGLNVQSLLSRLEPPIGTKGGPFVPVSASNRDKRPLSPPLARLAVGPGTKATYCPGPKGCRDKWPGTKTYSVVVNLRLVVTGITTAPCAPAQDLQHPWVLCTSLAARTMRTSSAAPRGQHHQPTTTTV